MSLFLRTFVFLFLGWQGAAAQVVSIKPGHVSPFCPSVSRAPDETLVSLPNMHEVLKSNPQGVRVLRGNSPYLKRHVEELMELGVGRVIVFKNFYSYKKRKELENLYGDTGFDVSALTHLPLPWQADDEGVYDEVGACKLTMQALKIVRESQVPVFVHCTVGEDRTGMLSGLIRMEHEGWTLQEAFQKEMCERGYEAGNPEKALEEDVVWAVRNNITPLFLKMATMLQQGRNTEDDCDSMPTKMIQKLQPEDLRCQPVVDDRLLCEG